MGGPIGIEQRGWEQVIHDSDHLVTKVRWKDLPDSDRGDFRCWRAVDLPSCDLVKRHGDVDPDQYWLR